MKTALKHARAPKARLDALRQLPSVGVPADQIVATINALLREFPFDLKVITGVVELCCRLRSYASAEQILDAATKELGPQPELVCAGATIQIASGRLGDAITIAQSAAERFPKSAHPRLYLGHIYLRGLRFREAEAEFRLARRLAPNDFDVEQGLAETFRCWGRYDKAIPCYRRALEMRPDSVEAHLGLALSLRTAGDYDDAIEHYDQVLALQPDDLHAISGRAEALHSLGDVESARALVEGALAQGRSDTTIGLAYARLAPKIGKQTEAIALLEQLLGSSRIPDLEKINLHFSLGQLYEARGDPQRAFAAYQAGNAAYPKRQFDADAYGRWVSATCEFFSRERVAALPNSGEESELPLFIVGMPRSGTSLVEQILSSHPRVFGAGELRDIPEFVGRLAGALSGRTDYPMNLAIASRELLQLVAREYLTRLSELGPGMARVTDKLPDNYQHLGLIALLFPRARIIHCVRDPLDTCLSCHATMLSSQLAYSRDLTELGKMYRHYERLMAHWKQTLSLRMLEVRYEELVRDLEGQSRRMIEFCGLEWDASCLRYHESRRVTITASQDQVRKPIYETSIGRAARFGQALDPLRAALEAR